MRRNKRQWPLTSRLLFLIAAVFSYASVRAADDIVVPAVLDPLSYQERLVACSVYFGAKARDSAHQPNDVEIWRVRALQELRYEGEVLVAQNEVIPTIRSRVASTVAKA